jgi:hypothetical protein
MTQMPSAHSSLSACVSVEEVFAFHRITDQAVYAVKPGKMDGAVQHYRSACALSGLLLRLGFQPSYRTAAGATAAHLPGHNYGYLITAATIIRNRGWNAATHESHICLWNSLLAMSKMSWADVCE